MADSRILERTMKLLRLAAPSSKAPEPERASAALEAAKLIDEHKLIVASAPVKQPLAPPDYPASAVYEPPIVYSRSNWHECEVPDRARCVSCKKSIQPGETAWFDDELGWRHYDITCDMHR